MALRDVLAKLSVSLNLETTAFERGTGRAEKRMVGFERTMSRAGKAVQTAFVGMLGVFAVDRILAVASAGLEYAASLGEQAQQLGVTTRALQEYRFAGQQAGLTTEQIDNALKNGNGRLGEAATGSGKAAAAYKKLGVDIRDADGKIRDIGDIIPQVAEALTKIESPAERAAVQVALFGKSGQDLGALLAGGAAGVNNLRNEAQRLGIVMSDELIAKADAGADELAALKQVLEVKVAVGVAENIDTITDALTSLIDFIAKAIKAWGYFTRLDFTPIALGGRTVEAQFQQFENQDRNAAIFRGDPLAFARIGEDRPGVVSALTPAEQAQYKKRLDAERFTRPAPAATTRPINPAFLNYGQGNSLTRRANALGGLRLGGNDFSRFTPGAGASDWAAAASAANDVSAAAGDIAAHNSASARALAEMAGDSAPKLTTALGKMKDQVEALRDAGQNILARLFPEQAEVARYRSELEILTQLQRGGQITAADYATAVDALRREFNGFADALAANQEILVTGIGPGLEEAIDGARESWAIFADSLVDDSKTTRVAVADTFAGLAQDVLSSLDQLSSAVRGGGFLDILSAVVGLGLNLGRAGVFGKSVQTNLARTPGYANGTSFARGGLSLVGERGPELVSLPRGARVTPNNDLAGMGGIAQIVPSPYFDVVVDGRIVSAAPGIATAGAGGALARLGRSSRRRLTK